MAFTDIHAYTCSTHVANDATDELTDWRHALRSGDVCAERRCQAATLTNCIKLVFDVDARMPLAQVTLQRREGLQAPHIHEAGKHCCGRYEFLLPYC